MKKIAIAAIVLASMTASAGNVANGAKVFKKVNCAMCHNKDGMGKAKNGKLGPTKGPRIAGLDEKYIVEQMNAIKSKSRKTKFTAMMYAKIRKLTDAEIADVAAHVAKMGSPFKGMNQK